MRPAIFLAIVLMASGAQAAEFSRSRVGGGDQVTLSGPIVDGDYERFLTAIGPGDAATRLVLKSDGGSIVTALKIGDYVYRHRLATAVGGSDRCASACGLIWIAGSQRYASNNAQIGFHAAFDASNGNQITSVGNALVGAYLARMGLSDRAISFVTSAPPSEMRWLSTSDAHDLGIPISRLPDSGAPTAISMEPSNPLAAGAAASVAVPAALSQGATTSVALPSNGAVPEPTSSAGLGPANSQPERGQAVDSVGARRHPDPM